MSRVRSWKLALIGGAFVAAWAAGCSSDTSTPGESAGSDSEAGDVNVIDPADVSNEGNPSAGGSKDGAGSGGDTGGGGGSGESDGDSGELDSTEPNCSVKPYDFGCPCEETGDCESGFCIESLVGYICTDDCVETCPDGWNCLPVKTGVGSDVAFVCVPTVPELCAACTSDADCGGPSDHCVPVGTGGNRCAGQCVGDGTCPEGYQCEDTTSVDGVSSKQCVPETGSCECTPELDGTSKACFSENEHGACVGQTTCDGPFGWSVCNAATPAPETCDGIDNNCNGVLDEGFEPEPCVTTNEHGSCPGNTVCGGLNGVQCDAPAAIPDICDGLDNDCDGAIDELDGDLDEDGKPDCTDDDVDGDGDPNPTDCAPYDDTIYTGAPELCDGKDTDCSGVADDGFPNTDGDGSADCIDDDDDDDGAKDGVDCQPLDGSIYPGAPETCDGIDNDCNTLIDEVGASGCTTFYLDADKDGAAGQQTGCFCNMPEFYAVAPTDCDDGNSNIYPGAAEVCNKADDNCNGEVDEGAESLCETYYFDGDGDKFGLAGDSQCTCGPQGQYTATEAGDCDDTNAAINPGVLEPCNGQDDNCNDIVDEGIGGADCTVYFFDGDGDSVGVAANAKCMCASEGDYDTTVPGDCNDANGAVFPGATEVCNGQDDNCSNAADEGCDDDGDQYCDAALSVQPGAFCANGPGDCNDFSPSTYPGAKETCNGKDDDCDGLTDDGVEAPCGGCKLVCQLEVGQGAPEPFNQEGYNGVSDDPNGGGLTLDSSTVQFHMLWVANSAESTISKLDTESGKEVARYAICGNPSRTAVDLEGDCWAGCRADGKVAKIKLDPSTCKDKNGNGVIETSADFNGDGKISGSELLPSGSDECVDFIVKVDNGENVIRAVAVDKDNYAWVGGWDTRKAFRLDPSTGAVTASVSFAALTNGRPYGFAIDQSQRLWVSLRDGTPAGLGMVDLKNFPLSPQVWGTPGSHNTYGIAVDSLGNVWLAGAEQMVMSRFNPNNNTWISIGMGNYPYIRGVAATPDGRVYAAHQTWGGSCDADHYISVYDAATAVLINVIDYAKPGEPRGPVGLSFDFSGHLWAINQCGSTASKLDPVTGNVIGTYPVGAEPYTYSDMTGYALKTVVSPEGAYLHTFKGWEGEQTKWYQITVGALTPPGTFFEVEYRTSETIGGLAAVPWSTVMGPYPPEAMPIDLTDGGDVLGKYLQVRVTLVRNEDAPAPPLLKSIDVVAAIAQ